MIHITEQAGYKIKNMMAEEENPDALYLRIEVKDGGCSGLSYGMGFDTEKHDDDEEFTQNGIRVIVDKQSLPYLHGLEVDYKESMMGGGFTLHNPNATVTCGCGTSFRTATRTGKPERC